MSVASIYFKNLKIKSLGLFTTTKEQFICGFAKYRGTRENCYLQVRVVYCMCRICHHVRCLLLNCGAIVTICKDLGERFTGYGHTLVAN